MFHVDVSVMANQSYVHVDNTTKSVAEFKDRNASYKDNTTESLMVYNEIHSSYILNNTTESLTDFNDRYASALLPITVVFGLLGVVGFCGILLL